MTMMLAPFAPETVTSLTPAWANYAKTTIYSYLSNKGFPVGSIEHDDNLLFIGESDPQIQRMAISGKQFSVVLFLPNPFHVLSEYALDKIDTIYTVNHEQTYLIKEILFERYGNAKDFKIMQWKHFVKPFEPPIRLRRLIGIVEPDFNSHEIFDRLYDSLNAFLSGKLYSVDYDIAFYTFNQDTFNRVNSRSLASRVPIYDLNDPVTTNEIATVPNVIISTDVYKYNPVLSGWAQRLPVLHPAWAVPHYMDRLAQSLISTVQGAGIVYDLLSNLVNQLDKIVELEQSTRIQDAMIRNSLLGDLYGDYSRSKHFPSSN